MALGRWPERENRENLAEIYSAYPTSQGSFRFDPREMHLARFAVPPRSAEGAERSSMIQRAYREREACQIGEANFRLFRCDVAAVNRSRRSASCKDQRGSGSGSRRGSRERLQVISKIVGRRSISVVRSQGRSVCGPASLPRGHRFALRPAPGCAPSIEKCPRDKQNGSEPRALARRQAALQKALPAEEEGERERKRQLAMISGRNREHGPTSVESMTGLASRVDVSK